MKWLFVLFSGERLRPTCIFVSSLLGPQLRAVDKIFKSSYKGKI